ncbi:putative MFS transporter [Lophiostoma macrostomum CBS 122681]|uniref:Putative MFS transporter n=1 Tax=Lophiostoma macrostomum CBS 122681 TaxID=1314788 RepID=A0A6A6T0P2_9PLEO|nr:putative MFS transporter [Lophiostoma macrostomum CBS 122681]
MGLLKDLHLQGNDFTNVATAFFVAYIVAEIPNIYLLQRIPAAKWLALNVILWGIATTCTTAAKDFSTLLAARILLGIFEATTLPSANTILAQWYTKSEAAPRYAYWFLGNGFSQVLGGLISFGFQYMKGGVLSGWRTMFLVFGLLTVGVGAIAAWYLPDTPMQARFLTDMEKISLLNHIAVNKIGVRNQKLCPVEIREALADPQVWIFCLAGLFTASSSGIITTYSSTIIRNMGYTPKLAALLNMPSGFVSIVSTLFAGYATRVTPGHHRWLWISVCALTAALGAALLSFLPPSKKAGLLAGAWLINAITATLPMLYHYLSVNVAGHTKRSFVANAVAISFGLGNIIGPQSFQARDAPQYMPGKIVTLATEVAMAVCMVVLVLYYVWENGRRDGRPVSEGTEQVTGDQVLHEDDWKGLTDRRNKGWRYVY